MTFFEFGGLVGFGFGVGCFLEGRARACEIFLFFCRGWDNLLQGVGGVGGGRGGNKGVFFGRGRVFIFFFLELSPIWALFVGRDWILPDSFWLEVFFFMFCWRRGLPFLGGGWGVSILPVERTVSLVFWWGGVLRAY